MALMITDECICCGACIDECPNEAISVADHGQYQIAPDRCTQCVGFHAQPQCVAVCPADCCVLDPAHVESEAELLAKARR